jgi:uncharacterized membrane protein YqjE
MLKSGALVVSMRNMMEAVLALVHNRVELASVELREEKSRLMSMVVCGALGVFLAFMTVVVLTFAVVVAFWENALMVLIGFALFYFLGALIAFLLFRSRVKAPPPFSETIDQIRKDREWLRNHH